MPIEWNISNKYYTAKVHFKPLRSDRYGITDLTDVPAVIYVWSPGEVGIIFYSLYFHTHNHGFVQQNYKKTMEDLSEDLKSHEPEVLLAIRTSESKEDESEEDFFNEKGFELVYGDVNGVIDSCDSGSMLEQHRGYIF